MTESASSSLKGEVLTIEPDRIGRAIARRSAEIRATVPDLELVRDADARAAVALARDRDVSLTAVLARACALALRDVPRANGAYRDGRYELYSRINLGIAIHTEDGQAVPAVLDADTRSLEQVSEELQRLTARAHAGELTPPELAGTTFQFTDAGALGVDRYSPLVIPPQAGALGAGAVRDVPVVRDGQVLAGQVITLTLVCDHRILFGVHAAELLNRFVAHVQEPVL